MSAVMKQLDEETEPRYFEPKDAVVMEQILDGDTAVVNHILAYKTPAVPVILDPDQMKLTPRVYGRYKNAYAVLPDAALVIDAVNTYMMQTETLKVYPIWFYQLVVALLLSKTSSFLIWTTMCQDLVIDWKDDNRMAAVELALVLVFRLQSDAVFLKEYTDPNKTKHAQKTALVRHFPAEPADTYTPEYLVKKSVDRMQAHLDPNDNKILTNLINKGDEDKAWKQMYVLALTRLNKRNGPLGARGLSLLAPFHSLTAFGDKIHQSNMTLVITNEDLNTMPLISIVKRWSIGINALRTPPPYFFMLDYSPQSSKTTQEWKKSVWIPIVNSNGINKAFYHNTPLWVHGGYVSICELKSITA